jgi:hypothetical protein
MMLRIAYAFTVLTLLGASALAGTGIESRKDRLGNSPDLVLLRMKLSS